MIRAFIAGLDDAERLFLSGLGLLAAGCACWWPPLALIVPGAVLTALGIAAVWRR
jgi:hypothetical protein